MCIRDRCGGNLFDAVSIAVKSALYNTHIPRVTAAEVDGNQVDFTLSDDPFDCWTLDITAAPVLVTLCKVTPVHLSTCNRNNNLMC